MNGKLLTSALRGCDWGAVAAALGGTSEGRRKQLSRAIEAHRARARARFGRRLTGPQVSFQPIVR